LNEFYIYFILNIGVFMWNVLRFVKDKLVWILPAAMISGLVLGATVDVAVLKALIVPLTILMVLPMMVNLEWSNLISRNIGSGFMPALGINLVIIPFLAYGIGRLIFPDDPSAIIGLVLIGTLPTSGMTISWTGFAKGNVRAAVRNVLAGLLIGAVMLPLYMKLFFGEAFGVPTGQIFRQIAIILLIPMAVGGTLGILLRKKLKPDVFAVVVKPKMPLLSTAAVVLMVFSAIALKAHLILAAPENILRGMIALILFYGIAFVVSHFMGRLLPERGDALALVFSTAVRNLSIVLALSIFLLGDGGGSASLLSSLAFLIQVQAAAWYVKFEERRRILVKVGKQVPAADFK
jgi:ACR3 family arsenite efflux pump ArsB